MARVRPGGGVRLVALVTASAFDGAERWIDALIARHTANFSRPEFLKAARALSARYVERRDALPGRSALDSAGKRAAFAALYAPLHALTTAAVVAAIGAAADARELLDLGCGTGAASLGWAMAVGAIAPPAIVGVDRDTWALGEAAWNWRTVGLAGRTRREDLVEAARGAGRPSRAGRRTHPAVVLGWAVNELDATGRAALLDAVLDLTRAGTAVLVLEPLATRAVPWWPDWTAAFANAGAQSDTWSFEDAVPAALVEWREAAGFRRRTLDARSLWIPGREAAPAVRGTMPS